MSLVSSLSFPFSTHFTDTCCFLKVFGDRMVLLVVSCKCPREFSEHSLIVAMGHSSKAFGNSMCCLKYALVYDYNLSLP